MTTLPGQAHGGWRNGTHDEPVVPAAADVSKTRTTTLKTSNTAHSSSIHHHSQMMSSSLSGGGDNLYHGSSYKRQMSDELTRKIEFVEEDTEEEDDDSDDLGMLKAVAANASATIRHRHKEREEQAARQKQKQEEERQRLLQQQQEERRKQQQEAAARDDANWKELTEDWKAFWKTATTFCLTQAHACGVYTGTVVAHHCQDLDTSLEGATMAVCDSGKQCYSPEVVNPPPPAMVSCPTPNTRNDANHTTTNVKRAPLRKQVSV